MEGPTPAELAAALSHDLRTPLGALSSALELLALPDLEAALQEDARAVARRQGQRLAALLDDLDTLAGLWSATTPASTEVMDFTCLAEAAWAAAREEAGPRCTMALQAVPGLLATGEPDALRRLLGVLCSHAARVAQNRHDADLRTWREGDDVQWELRVGSWDAASAADDTAPRMGLPLLLAQALARRLGGSLQLRRRGADHLHQLRLPAA